MRSLFSPAAARVRKTARRGAVALTLLLAGAAAAPLAPAQEADLGDPNVPVLVINIASIERLLNQAVFTFEAADRPELSETVGGALERVNDLEGFDRGLSMGVMVFLNGLVPDPVAYVPVKNLDEFLKTIEIGPVTTNRVGDERFEVLIPGRTLHGRIIRDYAFVANDKAALDREFGDPVRLTSRLSRDYDLSASINLKSIPPATRDLFVNVLRANSENNLQRRDDEPEGQYRIRRAAGLSNVDSIETLVSQGEELTIGWLVSSETKTATLEFVIRARPDSEYAQYFNESKGFRSQFANLLSDHSPLSASITSRLDKPTRKAMQEIITAAETQVLKDRGIVAESGETEGEIAENPVHRIANVLRSTVNAGTIDAAAQYVGSPGGTFVLIGALKITDAGTLDDALRDILGGLKKNPAVDDVRFDVLKHKGVSLHRVEFRQSDESTSRLYGGKPGLLLGVGDNALWLAFGAEAASVDQLESAIDKTAEPLTATAPDMPFRMIMNFSQWMHVFDPEKKADGFAPLARASFAKGGDALRFEARPIDDGIRIRITLDEAFIRLVGQQFARQIDRNADQ